MVDTLGEFMCYDAQGSFEYSTAGGTGGTLQLTMMTAVGGGPVGTLPGVGAFVAGHADSSAASSASSSHTRLPGAFRRLLTAGGRPPINKFSDLSSREVTAACCATFSLIGPLRLITR